MGRASGERQCFESALAIMGCLLYPDPHPEPGGENAGIKP